MIGKYKKLLFGGSSSIAFAIAGIPLPGCESMMLDPQAFFAENTCNIFNCDTLFFLQDDHADMDMEDTSDDHDDMDMVIVDDHTH